MTCIKFLRFRAKTEDDEESIYNPRRRRQRVRYCGLWRTGFSDNDDETANSTETRLTTF